MIFMENKFIKYMVANPILRASDIKRYSGVDSIREEDILQHTTRVMIISYMLASKLREFGEEIDTGKLLEKGLLHDIDESLTGDIPRPVKYYTSEVLSGLRLMASESAKRLVNNAFDLDEKSSTDHIIKVIDECKEEKEGYLIKIADLLTVACKAYEEVVMLGNLKFLKVTNESVNYLKELSRSIRLTASDMFNEASISYLEDMIFDSIVTLRDINTKHQQVIQSMYINGYDFTNNSVK